MPTTCLCLHRDHMALNNVHKMAARQSNNKTFEGLWTKISGIGSYQDKTDYSCPNTDVLWPTSTKPAAIHSTNNLPWIRLLECCLMNSLPRHVSCFWLTVWGGIWFKLTAWQVLNISFATDLNWRGCYSAFRSKLCKLLDILPATITTNV